MRRELRSVLSNAASASTAMNCGGTMKVWVMRSRSTVSRKLCAVKLGMTCTVPPANSAGSIASHVPLE